jgi:hypothetical protein
MSPAVSSESRRPGLFGTVSVDGRAGTARAWAEHRWHALDVNPYPPSLELFAGDLRQLIREYAIVGHAPSEPLLDEGDWVVTVGSCFAGELRGRLRRAGLASSRLWVPTGLNNTFAMLDFVSWCVTGEETGRGFRYDRLESGEIGEWKPEEERARYEARFAEAGAFVFTLGLAEVWEDRVTGGVFWRGVPEEIFDTDRHVFRLTTVDENTENIRRIIDLVRRVNPRAPIVLTLSPVPLKATFRDISCMSADCVSKSVLRVAIDQVMTEDHPHVYYWPSYELVRWVGAHLPWQAYGLDKPKPRSVSRYLVDQIVDAFLESFYRPRAVDAIRAAGAADRMPSAAN